MTLSSALTSQSSAKELKADLKKVDDELKKELNNLALDLAAIKGALGVRLSWLFTNFPDFSGHDQAADSPANDTAVVESHMKRPLHLSHFISLCLFLSIQGTARLPVYIPISCAFTVSEHIDYETT